MTEDLKVGEKIKLLREKKKLSLPDLASKSGFSSAILSQIENHMISPPLGTIIKLAKALEVEPGYFFKEKPKSPYVIVRKDERLSVSRVASREGVITVTRTNRWAPTRRTGKWSLSSSPWNPIR